MENEKGNLSISTENIFPIIKQWLYSEKDIFIRELVSNANDAIVKFEKLVNLGEAENDGNEVFKIEVKVDKENKTISISDNGIGMTADEVKKYINQIAFSGAKDFIEKYKDKAEEAQIIGHFGLGFYSAFMVSDKVRIDTLSYIPDSEAVAWESDGSTEYQMGPSERNSRGTTITLYVSEDAAEYLEHYRLRENLIRFFKFLPHEIYLTDEVQQRNEDKKEDENKEAPKPINNTNPLWNKKEKDCTDDEYKQFYKEVFNDYEDPLFWVHLNVDYPFKLKGILFFPKLKHEFNTLEGQVKLYCNQVFVADNIKEVIPEFLLLLKGCIDSPDLPLNVSRSFLQSDGTVKKISSHIVKKVADKLTQLYENDKDSYYKYWDDINPFIKYGCMRDEKFYERINDKIIFKTLNDDYKTIKEYIDNFADKKVDENSTQSDVKETKIIYYVSDLKQQAQYVNIFKDNNLNAVILNALIDSHFISFLEMKLQDVKFKRIDSDLSDSIKEKNDTDSLTKENTEAIENAVKEINPNIKVKFETLSENSVPAIVLLTEESRRFQEMSRMYGGMNSSGLPSDETLVLNYNHKLVKNVASFITDDSKKEDAKLLLAQLYDLAMISHKPMEPEDMKKFVERSTMILEKIL